MSHHGEFCQFTEDVQLCPLSSSPDHHGSLSAYIAVWCPFRWQTMCGSGSPEGWQQHSYIRDGMAMGIIIIIMQKIQERSRMYIMSVCSWNDVLDNLEMVGLETTLVLATKTLLYVLQPFCINNSPLKETRQPKQHLLQSGLQSICILASDAFLCHYISQGLQITQNLE